MAQKLEMLKTAYNEYAFDKTLVFEFLFRFQTGEISRILKPVLVVLRHKPVKMLKYFEKTFWEIDGKPGKKLWICLEWFGVRFRFSQKNIWGWKWCLPNLCFDRWLLKKNKVAWKYVVLWKKNFKMFKLFSYTSQVTDHNAMPTTIKRSNNQTSKRLYSKLTSSQKCSNEIKLQNDADFVFLMSQESSNQFFTQGQKTRTD